MITLSHPSRFRSLLVFACLFVAPPQFGRLRLQPTFDVKAHGAKADGHSLDTQAINGTIEAAAAAGGGTAIFRQAPTSLGQSGEEQHSLYLEAAPLSKRLHTP